MLPGSGLLRRIGERLRLARQIGLRLARAVGVGHFAAAGLRRLLVAGVAGVVLFGVVEEVVAHVAAHVGFGPIVELRILLAELFLRSGDQTIVVLGVLIVVLGGHRVSRRLRVAGKLNIFLGDVRRISADLDVGSVELENPRHRVLVLTLMMM